ncbi:MAG: acetyl-CoA carboxylase biotin carboxyl carrier protein subunit [Ruminococcus sp.]|nr:acetyl-CoA carboxylase biotin carboxyl carrier protein subunit [Ruminococcus sp.]
MKKKFQVTVNGTIYHVAVEEENESIQEIKTSKENTSSDLLKSDESTKKSISQDNIQGEIIPSPMPGTIIKVNFKTGETIKKGQSILILEAMKMENDIVSPKDGIITNIFVNAGDTVKTDDKLASID